MKQHVKRPLVAMTLCALALTSCVTTGPDAPLPDKIMPPARLTTCAAEPLAPALPVVDWSSVETARPVQRERDKAMLDYVLALRSAGASCRGNVDGLKAWVAEQ